MSSPQTWTNATRRKYAKIVCQHLKADDVQCLTRGDDGFFHLGNMITLSKRIGSDSNCGIAFLAEGGSKSTEIIKVAAKVMGNQLNNVDSRNEERVLKILRIVVWGGGVPNFPIAYNILKCDKAICTPDQPGCHSLFQNKHMVVLNEVAKGDLGVWLRAPRQKNECISAIFQICIALMAFNQLGFIHGDMHWGNVLYHEVPAGGCWHYRVNGKDIYIENTGQLWVLWDFGMSAKYKTYNQSAWLDYLRIMHSFMLKTSKNFSGWLDKGLVPESVSKQVVEFMMQLRYDPTRTVYDIIPAFWPQMREQTGKVLNAAPFVVDTSELATGLKVLQEP